MLEYCASCNSLSSCMPLGNVAIVICGVRLHYLILLCILGYILLSHNTRDNHYREEICQRLVRHYGGIYSLYELYNDPPFSYYSNYVIPGSYMYFQILASMFCKVSNEFFFVLFFVFFFHFELPCSCYCVCSNSKNVCSCQFILQVCFFLLQGLLSSTES